MEDRIVLKFNRHALHQDIPGSWFLPQSPRVKGNNLFLYDESVSNLMDRVTLASARITNIYEGPYMMPVTELSKAARARTEWLNRQFVTVANRIHREVRSRPEDEYRYHSLHPGQGEWIARYVQPATNHHVDYRLNDLKRMVGSPLSSFQELYETPLARPDIQERHLLKGIRELKAMGPAFRAPREMDAHIASVDLRLVGLRLSS